MKVFLQFLKCNLLGWMGRLDLNFLNKFEGERVLKINHVGSSLNVNVLPKIIWIYWEDKHVPKLVKKVISKIESYNPNFEVRFVNKYTLANYLPNFEVLGEMPIANKTDIIRLDLLLKYGGVWIDATTLVFENFEWVENAFSNTSLDLVGYYRDNSTIDYDFPIIESWFLAAFPNNKFIAQWRSELEGLRVLGSKVYFERLRKRSDYDIIKQKIANPEYLLVYLAQQIALRKLDGFNLYLKRAEDSAFAIQEHYGWNIYSINYVLNRVSSIGFSLPIVKLISGDRMFASIYSKMRLVKKSSLLGRIII